MDTKGSRQHCKRIGCTNLHTVVGDEGRVVYVGDHDEDQADTHCGFWRRDQDWFWSNQMPVDEVLTDNGPNFISAKLPRFFPSAASSTAAPVPCRPQTNGKAERFNRTSADEFLYARRFRSETGRRIRLRRWVHDYNCHRHRTAVGGPLASRAQQPHANLHLASVRLDRDPKGPLDGSWLKGEAMSWGFDPSSITVYFYGLVLAVAIVRQFAAWRAGWKAYGPANTLGCETRFYKPEAAARTMRCRGHLEQVSHPHDYSSPNQETYEMDPDALVGPVRAGTRQWTFDETASRPRGPTRWILCCLWLALRRRFREPFIDPCQWCEA